MPARTHTLCLLAALALAGCRKSEPAPGGAPSADARRGPHLQLKERAFDLGEVDNGRTYEHAFPVVNAGDEPLNLALTRKSCACGEVVLPERAIQPGQTGNVTVRWSPLPGALGPVTLAAECRTNDPATPSLRLEVNSRVRPRIRIEPAVSFLDFGTIRPAASLPGRTLKVFSTRLPAFELQVEVATGGLEVMLEPLPEGDYVRDEKVRCGYRVGLKTTAKLSPGYFRDDLVLLTRVPGEAQRRLSIPLYGTVENGVFRVTPEEVAFRKPRVTEADSRKVRVQFLVPSDRDGLEVVSLEPPFLTATPPARLGKGLWEFSVGLPADSAEAARYQPDGFFEGRVVLRARPGSVEVPVRVKWVAPEGK